MSTVKTALVISGGGSKGSFAVGVLEHLVGTLGMNFDILAGTSTGALITPVLAALGKAALPLLKQEYTTVHTPDILKKRFPEETAITSTSVYTTEPLAGRIKTQVTNQQVFEKLAASQKQVFLTAVSLETGKLTYYRAGANVPVANPDVVHVADRDGLMRAMLASASIPVLMNPVRIPATAEPLWVDGGVREYAPVKIAIDAGATDIVCVLLSPKGPKPAGQPMNRLVPILQRAIDLLSEEVGDNDVQLAQLYTLGTRYIEEVKKRLARDFGMSAASVESAFAPPNAPNPFAGKKAVALRVIRPLQKLQGETLAFDPAAMQANLAAGIDAAKTQLPAGGVLV